MLTMFKIKGSASLSKAGVVFSIIPVLHDGEKNCEFGGTFGVISSARGYIGIKYYRQGLAKKRRVENIALISTLGFVFLSHFWPNSVVSNYERMIHPISSFYANLCRFPNGINVI